MNLFTKSIPINPRSISNAKINRHWDSWNNLSGASIRFFDMPCTVAKETDEENDRKNSHKSPSRKAALFPSFNIIGHGIISPSLQRDTLIKPYYVTIRSKSTVPGVDGSSPPTNSEKIALKNSSSNSSQDSSDDVSRGQQAREVAKKSAFSIRDLIKKYGWTFIGTYLGVYFATLGTLFISIDSGLLDPITITSIELPWHTTDEAEAAMATDKEDFDSAVEFISSYMKKFPWTEPYADIALKNPHTTNLALAWIAVKFTEPIRLPLSIGIVRKITNDRDQA